MAPSEPEPSLSKPKPTEKANLSASDSLIHSICTELEDSIENLERSESLAKALLNQLEVTIGQLKEHQIQPELLTRYQLQQANIKQRFAALLQRPQEAATSGRRLLEEFTNLLAKPENPQEKQGMQAALALIVDLNESKRKNGIHSQECSRRKEDTRDSNRPR
jgi:hypothetical protein